MQSLSCHLDTASGEFAPSRERDSEFADAAMMEDVWGAEEVIAIDFFKVKSNIGKKQLSVLEVFECDLVGEEFVEGAIEDVLDEVFDWAEIGEALEDSSQHTFEDHG